MLQAVCCAPKRKYPEVFEEYNKARGVLVVEAEREDGGPHTACVIFGHGLGDTPLGCSEQCKYWAANLPWVRFVLPAAPDAAVTINGGEVMPSWYDVHGLEDRTQEPFTGLDGSRDRWSFLLKREAELLPGGAARVVLAGFSQGGGLALYTGLLRHAAVRAGEENLQELPPVAGILAMSCSLPAMHVLEEAFQKRGGASEKLRGVPVLQCQGSADPAVPVQRARGTQEFLGGIGMERLEFKEYEGLGHDANMAEMDDVVAWLSEVLPEEAIQGAPAPAGSKPMAEMISEQAPPPAAAPPPPPPPPPPPAPAAAPTAAATAAAPPGAPPSGAAGQWSMAEVSQYLEALGLGQLKPAFEENAVDGEMLVGLSEEDLVSELGCTKLQARKVMQRLPR